MMKNVDKIKGRMDEAGRRIKTDYSRGMALLVRTQREVRRAIHGASDDGRGAWTKVSANISRRLSGIRKSLKGRL